MADPLLGLRARLVLMEPNNAVSIALPAGIAMVNLLGAGDANLREIEKAFPNLEIAVRGESVLASGDRIQVLLLEKLLLELSVVVRSGGFITIDSVKRSMKMITSDTKPAEVFSLNILSSRGRTIRPKTANQKKYVDAIDKNTIVFGIGPAGTGKTYLAVAKAIAALQSK